MKKILFSVLALIIIACTPQVTVTSTPQTSEVSETSEVLIPTQTPKALSQAFIDLQEEIAKSDIYTLTKDGFEIENEDGTITFVPNIKPNPFDKDLTFTITYEGQEFIVEFDSIEENKLSFTGENERTWIWDGNRLVHSYTQDELVQMTPEEKLAVAPETIGDLERSNISTIPDKDHLVLYRDENDVSVKVFNLLTAQELSLPEAGIIEFKLTNNTNFEVPAFISESTDEASQIATIEEMLNFMVADGVAWGDIREKSMTETIQADKDLFSKYWKIPTFTPKGSVILPLDNKIADENRFKIQYAGVQVDGWATSLVAFISDEGYRKSIFINIPVARLQNYLINLMVDIPPKPQQ